MNLWFRLLALLLRSPFRARLPVLGGVSRLRLRVSFSDLDAVGHMNNGRYWTLFDLGRLDLSLRTGLGRIALEKKWVPIMGAGTVRFRRELKWFQPFVLETRLLGWAGSRFIIEHRVLTGAELKLATRALVLMGLYDRRGRCFVPPEAVLGCLGIQDSVSLALDSASEAAIRAEAALGDRHAPDIPTS